MPAPTLTRVGELQLYELSSYHDARLGSFWAGYRPAKTEGFDPSGGLDAAWQDPGGVYLFLGALPHDGAAFATFSAALGDVLSGLPADTRILWIANPHALPGNWQVSLVQATSSGSGSGIAWSLTRSATLAIGEYAVELPRRTPIVQTDPDTTGYGIAVGGDGLAFAGPYGQYGADADTTWLPLAGATIGSWRARLTLPAAVGDGLAALRVGLRYAAPHTDGEPGDAVDVLDMSLIAQGTADLSLRLAFDPLNPLRAERTRLGFFEDDGSGAAPPSLAATLRTSRGYPTWLTPKATGVPLRPARLVLCRTPLTVADEPWAATLSYHLAPDGAFGLTVVPPAGGADDVIPPPPPDPHRLMLGMSGLEYTALDPVAGAVVFFAAGKPAFAPSAAPEAPATVPGKDAPLTDAATTAHVAVLPPVPAPPPGPGPGLKYYAQPRQAPLYSGGGNLGTGFLRFLEVAATTLPGWVLGSGDAPGVVPAGAMAGVAPADGPLASRIEHAALAPARRQAIGLPAADLELLEDGNGTPAVTPQGLLVEVGANDFERVIVANMPGTPAGRLDFGPVGDNLQAAIQANELFFVVGDRDKFMADSSIRFRLDATGLAVARARHVTKETLDALRSIVPFEKPDRQAFLDALPSVATAEDVKTLVEIAGFLKAEISRWTFQLSPPAWRKGPEAPTVMLFKFSNRSLADLAEDGAAWSWRGAVRADTQAELRRVFRAAEARSKDDSLPHDDPYAAFYRDVVANPSWNGVLFLNAPVSIAELPTELQFMAAGIDPERFYAHHVGFSATPVSVAGTEIEIKQTAAFGLIDYQDPVDLVLSPHNPNPDFGFKTLTLTARFANAALVGFFARVELMVNRLLGAPLTKLDPTHGNNLLLVGTSQRQGGTLSYAFALEGDHVYSTDRTVLDSIQVDAVRLLTTAGAHAVGEVATTFALGGWLRFVDNTAFDVFGYGAAVGDPDFDGRLRFDDLGVEMRFPLGTAHEQDFGVALSGVRLDTSRSKPRRRALISNFPVTLTGLASSTTQPPQDTGFASISTPVDQTPLTPPWYGLSYSLDLGTLGALAGATGLSLKLLAAWGPGADVGARPLYVGLELPGGMQWSLQSVMKLGFRSFQFYTAEQKDGGLAYMLRLRRFALSILSITLPPGNLDITLFGDPKDPTSRVVGWYAAYEDPAEKPALELERSGGRR